MLSFLCNDYVIPVITCVIQSSQSISSRCFTDTDFVFYCCFILTAEDLTSSFTERLAQGHMADNEQTLALVRVSDLLPLA